MISFEGIGTKWWIEIYDLQESNSQILRQELLDYVAEFENQYSRFKQTSLVGQLNIHKHLANTPDDLLEMIVIGEDAKEISKGHFDIQVAKHLEKLGYGGFNRSESTLNFVPRLIQVDKDSTTTIAADSTIDLGGIGKGYLIDKLVQLLTTRGYKYFFINAGGDIYATSEFGKPIEFALENPLDRTEMIGTISIKDSSIAASSPSRRQWQDKLGNKRHHLLNAINGEPINAIAGVFTWGKNAVDADVASTVLFVAPMELQQKIADKYQVEYLVVQENGTYFKSKNYPAKLYGQTK